MQQGLTLIDLNYLELLRITRQAIIQILIKEQVSIKYLEELAL